MLFVEINKGNMSAVLTECNSTDSSSPSWKLSSVKPFTSAGIPNVENWSISSLSSSALLPLGIHCNTHDLIGVILGFSVFNFFIAVDFSNSKEFLFVVLRVKDDSKRGGMVAEILIFIEEDILSHVDTSVSIDEVKLVFGLWLLINLFIVVLWLSDLSSVSKLWLILVLSST